MSTVSLFIIMGGVFGTLVLMIFAFSGPSTEKANSRRLGAIRERHSDNPFSADAQMRKAIATRMRKPGEDGGTSIIPNPELLAKRILMTGKSWTLSQYVIACVGIGLVFAVATTIIGAPPLLSIFGGLAIGLMIPHFVIGRLIKKRTAKFNEYFPDAIELMVRGLRSGLPISETLGVVGSELPGPISEEFRKITDTVKIGRTMNEALLEAYERLGISEFNFFCVTLEIQRETGGNLAETLSNLADVLRKRAQMKLKIKAMSSEAKASAYIIGCLPFLMFIGISFVNPKYVEGFYTDQRLMVAALVGFIMLGIGAFVMSKMINFEV
jgi:tight adherence protein B